MPSPIKLITGLGNPGPEYSATRHNAGFWFLDRLVTRHGGNFSLETKFFGETTRLRFDDVDCRLLKPSTFMNESGRAVQAVTDYYKIDLNDVLIVHDEIDLEPGVIRIKDGGGHGGHNGIRDIISNTGTNKFWRIRIGVGHPGHKDKVVNSVLGRANAEDQQLIDQAIEQGLEIMPLIFKGEFPQAMNKLHQNDKQPLKNEK